jgi:hypothetical protein
MDEWSRTWSWSFSSRSAEALFARFFPGAFSIQTYGNRFAAACYLHGVAQQELDAAALEQQDAEIEMLLAVRAVKSNEAR